MHKVNDRLTQLSERTPTSQDVHVPWESLLILSQGAMKQLVSSVVTGDNLAMTPPNFRLKVVCKSGDVF